MKKTLLIALACYGLNARAQTQDSKDFLYLYSDSIIYANDIKFRPDLSGNLRVRVDSRNVPIGQVKFLNTRDGFFANTRKIGGIGSEEFAERIIEGKINVFQERSLSYAPFIYNPNYAYETHYVPATVRSMNSSMYYNKGYADLKKLNYGNLKKDMADDPQSLDMLRAYRKRVNTTTSLYIAGAASMLAGVVVFASDGRNAYSNSKLTLGFSLSALGAGLITGGYFKSFSDKRRLETTIDTYNRTR